MACAGDQSIITLAALAVAGFKLQHNLRTQEDVPSTANDPQQQNTTKQETGEKIIVEKACSNDIQASQTHAN